MTCPDKTQTSRSCTANDVEHCWTMGRHQAPWIPLYPLWTKGAQLVQQLSVLACLFCVESTPQLPRKWSLLSLHHPGREKHFWILVPVEAIRNNAGRCSKAKVPSYVLPKPCTSSSSRNISCSTCSMLCTLWPQQNQDALWTGLANERLRKAIKCVGGPTGAIKVHFLEEL